MASYIGYEELNASTATKLSSSVFNPGNARADGATIMVDGDIIFRLDDTMPGPGQPVSKGAIINLNSSDQVSKFRFAGTGKLYCHYFVGNVHLAAFVSEGSIPSTTDTTDSDLFTEMRAVRKGIELVLGQFDRSFDGIDLIELA